MQIPEFKDLIKNKDVVFQHYRDGTLYYQVEGTLFTFPVPTNDVGSASMLPRDKAIYFMRWMRQFYPEWRAEIELMNKRLVQTHCSQDSCDFST